MERLKEHKMLKLVRDAAQMQTVRIPMIPNGESGFFRTPFRVYSNNISERSDAG
jgi:hypothetical protein